MSKLRTIHQSIIQLHEIDPRSAITEFWLRRRVQEGTVPSIKEGGRYLIDLDYLLNLNPIQIIQPKEQPKIRRISEK